MGPKRVELFAAIRFDWQRNQMSVRALSRKYDVHRRTVRQAIGSPVPPARKTPQRRTVVLDGVRGLIDGMLREDLEAPRKQRHTAQRVFGRLCDEHDARVSYSCRACHRVYASQAQEAFLEGHVAAFGVMGGLPYAQVRYDNLSPAVAKVLTGRNRTETARWLSFRAHYGFEAFYCVPGQEGAHEKGGVEGEIGRFRRRWFVPVPAEASLAELNARLAEADAGEDVRHIDQRLSVVGEDFAVEAPFLLPLPAEAFDTAATAWPRVDRYARIAVGKCRYSVPARLIDARVRVRLSANQLEVYDGSRLAAVHPRLTAAGAGRLDLDHYLEILLRKPGADRGAAAAPPDARGPGHGRDQRGAGGGQLLAGRGRDRGPQARRRPGRRPGQRAALAGAAAAAVAGRGGHAAAPLPGPAGRPAPGPVGGRL